MNYVRSLVLQLQNLATQLRSKRRILDAPRRHEEQHPRVLFLFVLLEFLDRILAVVRRNEVLQFWEIFNVLINLLKRLCKVQFILLFSCCALIEGLEGGFALGKFF